MQMEDILKGTPPSTILSIQKGLRHNFQAIVITGIL